MDTESIEVASIANQAGSENFPVALKVLPGRYKRQLLALYNFARLVDDLGDEYEGDRMAALDWAEEQLERPTHALFLDLHRYLLEGEPGTSLDKAPFLKLIEANRLDQTKKRYENFEELYGYCELSANPVGHIVLKIFKSDSLILDEYSDAVCTGLQILEHLQDISEDYKNGRIYMPLTEMQKFDVDESHLGKDYATPELKNLVMDGTQKVRQLLAVGAPLAAGIRNGWGRLAVSGYVAGGKAMADALWDAGGDIFHQEARKARTRRLLYYVARLTLSRNPLSRSPLSRNPKK